MKELKPKKRKTIVIFGVLLIVCIAILVIGYSTKEVYTTTEVKIMEATIVSKELSDNHYLEVNVPGITNTPLWVETTQDFYQQANPGQTVGVVIGAVDTYNTRKSWDKSQLNLKYSTTNWEVLSLYPTLADAQNENQPNKFTTTATLKQRIKSLDGRYFFLFDSGGKKIMAEVNNEYYQSYKPQSTPSDFFELEFEGIGDFNHLVRIVKP